MDIYIGIDGTPNNDNASSTAATEPLQVTSFVKHISLMNFAKASYIAGSTAAGTGYDSSYLAYQAFRWVQSTRGQAKEPDKVRVFLGGFSRGGASILLTCRHLESFNIPVHGLFLFDAVDRTPVISFFTSRTIPANVRQAFHAYRDPKADSRPEFGNCGMHGHANNLKAQSFYCTHGGMGGWRIGSERLQAPSDLASSMGTLGLLNLWTPPKPTNFSDMSYREKLSPNSSTKVTAIQQLSGSLAVWNWMQKNVLACQGWDVASTKSGQTFA